MAYAALGRLYGDIGETQLSAENSTKAYELRDRASDKERYWISAAYDMQVTGNMEKAEQTCKAWSEAYPRAVEPHSFSSGTISLVPGKYERAIKEAKAALGLDPDVAVVYSNLALGYVALGRIDEADETLSRASERKLTMPDFIFQRYALAFLKNDTGAMNLETAKAEVNTGQEDWMSNAEGFVLASAGHLIEAREMSRHAEDLAHAADLKETEGVVQRR
jgi:tetratricopeptide (TPR) repeat protein